MSEKVNRSLKYDSIFFCPQTDMDTNTNHFTPLALCLRGKIMFNKCDITCEKGPCRASFQNRVITTIGKSRL